MGLVTGLLGLPLAPLRGVLWVAEQIRDQAEEQYYDPVRIRAQLAEVDEARRSGVLPAEECDELEDELLQRLMTGPGRQVSGARSAAGRAATAHGRDDRHRDDEQQDQHHG